MAITALPTAPSTNDPANFATRADAWIAALATFTTEANALAAAMNLNSTTDTSASSVLIGLGEKTFTVSAGKSFQPGMFLIVADTSAPTTNSMYGQVSSYSGTSLVMHMLAVTDGTGSPTAPIAAWSISQSAGGGAYAAYSPLAGSATNQAGGTVDATTIAASGLISANGGQIKFPASQSASADANTLDDYEEGTFDFTGVGWTTSPTISMKYVKVGGVVHLTGSGNAITATSNATSKSLTGLPASLYPSSTQQFLFRAIDNAGTWVISYGTISSSGDVLLNAVPGGGVWTASGTAGVTLPAFSYPV